MRIKIFKDVETLSHFVADEFFHLVGKAVDLRGRFLVALAGGKTPQRFYEMIGDMNINRNYDIPWEHVHLFWGDERCVPPDHPESNYRQVKDALIQRVKLPDGNIHRMKGELLPEQAAEDYRLELKQWAEDGLDWPVFDFVLLGMGEDGHTASLFPGSDPDPLQAALAVEADYQGRPARRVTLTPRVFNTSRTIYVMAVGENKAHILQKVLQGEKDVRQFPIQRIHPNPGEMTWLLDEASARLL